MGDLGVIIIVFGFVIIAVLLLCTLALAACLQEIGRHLERIANSLKK